MKTLLLFALLLPTLTFAKKAMPYYVSYEEDSTLSASQTKVVIYCSQFNPEFGVESTILHYSMGKREGQLPAVMEQEIGNPPEPGSYLFEFFYTPDYEEIETRPIEVKPGVVTRITLHFYLSDEPVRMKKPVIYLYPETDTEVEVTVETENGLSFSYPVYANGWKGIAHPDGSMTIAGKTYPYLFWEADKLLSESLMNQSSGYIVNKESVIAFLESSLTSMGLRAKEQTDFITFWGPQLMEHEEVFLYFIWNEEVDQLSTLTVSGEPRINRLYMVWSSEIRDLTTALPKPLPVFDRSGFDVFEWGGMELPPRLTEASMNR